MKRPFLFCLCLALTSKLAAQELIKDQAWYLRKSKNQKTAAFILLGGGTALGLTGLLTGSKSETSFDEANTGALLGAAGILAVAGSIPLFVASKRNKQKAATFTAAFFRRSEGVFHYSIPVTVCIILKP